MLPFSILINNPSCLMCFLKRKMSVVFFVNCLFIQEFLLFLTIPCCFLMRYKNVPQL